MDNNPESSYRTYQCHSCSHSFDYPYPVETVNCLFCESEFCQLEEDILKDIQKFPQGSQPPPQPHFPQAPGFRIPQVRAAQRNSMGMRRTQSNLSTGEIPDDQVSQQIMLTRSSQGVLEFLEEFHIQPHPWKITMDQMVPLGQSESREQCNEKSDKNSERPNGEFTIESRSMHREIRPLMAVNHIHELFRRLLQARGGESHNDCKAQDAFVQSLLRYKIGTDISLEELKLKENVICCVCQDNYQNEQEIIEMPCKHLFHSECLLPWLEKRRSCPNCRDMLGGD